MPSHVSACSEMWKYDIYRIDLYFNDCLCNQVFLVARCIARVEMEFGNLTKPNLVLRHSVHHCPAKPGNITCWMAVLNTALCLATTNEEIKISGGRRAVQVLREQFFCNYWYDNVLRTYPYPSAKTLRQSVLALGSHPRVRDTAWSGNTSIRSPLSARIRDIASKVVEHNGFYHKYLLKFDCYDWINRIKRETKKPYIPYEVQLIGRRRMRMKGQRRWWALHLCKATWNPALLPLFWENPET